MWCEIRKPMENPSSLLWFRYWFTVSVAPDKGGRLNDLTCTWCRIMSIYHAEKEASSSSGDLGGRSQRPYLQCLVVSLQLPTQALQLAAGQDGLAVFALQVQLLLHDLGLLLLQHLHLLLDATALLQLERAEEPPYSRLTTHQRCTTYCTTSRPNVEGKNVWLFAVPVWFWPAVLCVK